MRDLNELQISHRGKRRKPPTDQAIQLFEEHYKVRLPSDYVDFLRFSNGGYPGLNVFQPKGDPEGSLRDFFVFYFLNERGWNDCYSLWRETFAWRPGLGNQAIPIAANGGGDQIALDFTTEPPRIVYFEHDDEFRATVVAESFTEFLDLLMEDPEEENE